MTGKIPNLSESPGGLAIKGSVIAYWSPFYQRYITRKWPRGNGGDTPRRALARAGFTAATQIIKQASSEERAAADALAANTPYLQRDLLMKAAMGTLWEVAFSDGTYAVSARMTNATIQQLLDSITNSPGAIIVRTPDEWSALIPGDSGQVLTVDPDTGLPEWLNPGGSGGGGGLIYSDTTAVTGPQAASTNWPAQSVTLPGGTLKNVGDTFEITTLCNTLNGPAYSKRGAIQFGATTIPGTAANAIGYWYACKARVIMTGVKSQLIISTPTVWSAALGASGAIQTTQMASAVLQTTEDETGPITISHNLVMPSYLANAMTAYMLQVAKV